MENKLVPKIRHEGFTGEWRKHRFQEFTKLSQGLQIAINKRYLEPGKDRLFYITNEFLNENSTKRYYIESAQESVIAGREDILMTRTGNTGKVLTDVEGAFHNNFFKIAYNNKETARLFLYYLLNTPSLQNEITVRAGTSTIPDLNHNDFYKMEITLPLIEEQTKIGNFIKKLDDIIATQEQELATLKQTKQGFSQKMFPEKGESVPEIRFPGFTGDWEQRKLGSLFNTYSGMTPLRSDLSNFYNPRIPWIKTTDLNNTRIESNEEKISDKAASKLRLLPKDTVLIAMYGGFNQIGRTGLLSYSATINQALIALEPIKDINQYFLLTQLNYRVNDWKRLAASSRKDPNITKKDVENFILYYSSIEEQNKISKIFRSLDSAIALHQRELDILKETKKAFLQKMFV